MTVDAYVVKWAIGELTAPSRCDETYFYMICSVPSVICEPPIALLGRLPRFKLAQKSSPEPRIDELLCEEKKGLRKCKKENAPCRGSNGLRTRYLIRTG